MFKLKKAFIVIVYHALILGGVLFLIDSLLKIATNQGLQYFPLLLSIAGVFLISYLFLMWKDLFSHQYHYYLRYTSRIVLRNVAIATGVTLLSLFFLMFGFKQLGIYDSVLIGFDLAVDIGIVTFVSIFTVCLLHALQISWIYHLSRLGFFKKRVLFVGDADNRFPVSQLFQDMGNTKEYIGKLTFRQDLPYFHKNDGEIELVEESIYDRLYKLNVGELIFFLNDQIKEDQLHQLVTFCRENSIGYYIVPDISKLKFRAPWNKTMAYIPLIERYSTRRDSLIFISIKRFFDILFSVMIGVMFLPFGLLIALGIKMYDRGPVFYISDRIGKNGKVIRFFKFRSMRMNADKQKAELLKYNKRKDGPLFKMDNDPRITPLGKILRKFSIDDIPQLINILRGDMSIIGPRPHLPEEVSHYSPRDYLRLECIPGVSCIPQIKGRNTLGFREWIEYDLEYRKNWSLVMDAVILLKTFKIVLEPLFSRKADGQGM